jgi:hypothetical protein
MWPNFIVFRPIRLSNIEIKGMLKKILAPLNDVTSFSTTSMTSSSHYVVHLPHVVELGILFVLVSFGLLA